jgi:hypothetical protein
MKTMQIEISKDQFMSLIQTLGEEDKLKVYDELKKTLFLKRFNKLLKTTKNSSLSLGEIAKEVGSVRKKKNQRFLFQLFIRPACPCLKFHRLNSLMEGDKK